MRLIFFGSGYCSNFIIPLIGKKFEIICTHNEKIKTQDYDSRLKVRRMLFNDFFKNSSVGPIPSSSSDYGQIDGVMILKLDKDSKVWASGVRTGDIISSINKVPVSSVADFVSLIHTQNERILLKVHRNGSRAFVLVE